MKLLFSQLSNHLWSSQKGGQCIKKAVNPKCSKVKLILHFNYNLIASFQIHRGCVQWQNYRDCDIAQILRNIPVCLEP